MLKVEMKLIMLIANEHYFYHLNILELAYFGLVDEQV